MRHFLVAFLAATLTIVTTACADGSGNADDGSAVLLALAAADRTPPVDLSPLMDPNAAPVAPRSTPPAVWIHSPPSGSSFLNLNPIYIIFTESMDPATLSLGGTMASQASALWYPYQFADQYLILLPTSGWPVGPGQTLTIDADDLSGDPLPTFSLTYTITQDTTAPTLSSVTPTDGASIWDVTEIRFVFDETLNSAVAPTFGGSMASQVNGYQYSSTNIGGDTLIVQTKTTAVPGGRWTAGTARTLDVTVEDPSGNSTTTSGIDFDISAISTGIVYVSTSGNDANAGTADAPKLTVGAGYSAVQQLMGTGRVHVAAGSYTENLWPQTEGISLYGGYSAASWAIRDPAVHVTTLNAATSTQPAIWMSGYSTTITNATVIDGFTLSGDKGLIVQYASPTISNNVINSTTWLALLVGNHGSPVITNNVINAPHQTGTPNGSQGVDIQLLDTGTASNVTFTNNTVNPGSCVSPCTATAVRVTIANGSATISGNTMTAGAARDTRGLLISNKAAYTVTNNVISAGGATRDTKGLYYQGGVGSTITIRDNVIDGSDALWAMGLDLEHNGTAIVERNTVYARSNGSSVSGSISTSHALHGSIDAMTIRNNVFIGGIGFHNTTVSFGGTGSRDLLNNTIIGGTGSHNINVALIIGGAAGRIENNIVIDTGNRMSGGATCIQGDMNSAAPVFTLKNNDIFGPCTNLVYDSDGGCGGGNYCNLTQLNSLGANFGGNVETDPLFTDADGADNDVSTPADNVYTLSSSTPVSVYEGGLDLSLEFTTDRLNVTRTSDWSMGAYEKD